MIMRGKNKSKQDQKPEVNKELEGLDISISSLGEIESSFDIDKINLFLDTHVKDKKLDGLDSNDSSKKNT